MECVFGVGIKLFVKEVELFWFIGNMVDFVGVDDI